MMDVVINNLAVGYGKRQVVAEGVTTVVGARQLTCLTGRNGTGKSTLLRTLAGLLPPLAGTVSFGSRLLADMSHAERARTVGVVLTVHTDTDRLTAEEVVALGRSPYTGFWGTLRAADRRIVEESIEAVGISHLAGLQMQRLSDGERQKVVIAKVLAQQTPVILLDEPTAFLDHPSKQELFSLLRQLAHEQQKTVLMSTHDVELAGRAADRLWELSGSK